MTVAVDLEHDSRTAWAYRKHLVRPEARLDDGLSSAIIAALGAYEHVELMGFATLKEGADPRTLTRGTDTSEAIAVRTIRRWIFIDQKSRKVLSVPGPIRSGVAYPPARFGPLEFRRHNGYASTLTGVDGSVLAYKVFIHDRAEQQLLTDGAGGRILRLPEHPDVPPIPVLGTSHSDEDEEAAPASLPGDWRIAEDIACSHMRSLGFLDAQRTPTGRDAGVDVSSVAGVAQVKMLALPVGSPPVQQLRGTFPQLPYHVFYSTSGYTRSAVEVAAVVGVALFRIKKNGRVEPLDEIATQLTLNGVTGSDAARKISAKSHARTFAKEVTERVIAASSNTPGASHARVYALGYIPKDHRRGEPPEPYPGDRQRINQYLSRGLKAILTPPQLSSPREALIHYHHHELMVHVWFMESGVPYPEGAGFSTHPEPYPTLGEFY